MFIIRHHVDQLIPGQKYHVVDKWYLNGERRKYPLYFVATFVTHLHVLTGRGKPLIRIVFLQQDYERIVNSMNEFYHVSPALPFIDELQNYFSQKIPTLYDLAKKAIPNNILKEIQGTIYYNEIYFNK